ncbi:head decoration protein [Castellaniella hirudinis]|uniref:head decoration protein n=1 Tax=Castellaniella hirudinis TaxID=1144617 RepID=UPI0039C26B5A
MPAQIQRKTLGDLLLAEVLPAWTRRRRILPAGDALPMGQVLFETAEIEPAGPDPETDPAVTVEIVTGVLAEDVAASASDRPGVVIERGAVVATAALIWPDGASPEDIVTWIDQLITMGVVPRATL